MPETTLPLVSIVTVSYNAEATLADTIASVRAQDYPNIELIVVDGASSDGTLDIIRANEDVIAHWVSEKDGGLYDAMNKGVSMATGHLVGMLNADDFLAGPQVISKMMSRYLAAENAQGVYADLNYVDPDNTRKVVRKWRSGHYSEGQFKWGWMPPHPTFYIQRELYSQFGGYRLDMGSAADYELMLRYMHLHKIRMVYHREVMVDMRAGGVSNASMQNRLKANQGDRKAWAVNKLKPYWFTLYLKPIRKIGQFI